MQFFCRTKDEVLEYFNTNPETGLSKDAALKLKEKYGLNKLKEKKKDTFLRRLFMQLKDTMILILVIAAVVSFVTACIDKNSQEFFEPALILFIVILNALMGAMQESKAEKSLDALKNMSVPYARVIRDSAEQIVETKELVPGDIIKLEAGDFVPADARLVKSAGLKCEESILTGESVPAEKNADDMAEENASPGDRKNMIFSGCSIISGTAVAVVTSTGMNTEMGKIANLLDSETEIRTPLQEKLDKVGKYLGFAALAACLIIFIVGIVSGIPVMEIFMMAVSLAVSAIPEGLPAIVTVVLSIGIQRMVQHNALIRRLPAVETLGSASVICSDKTGTLTQNRMTLTEAYVDGSICTENISESNSERIRKLLMYGTLCSDAYVTFGEEEKSIGDPTETAIISAACKNGIFKEELFAIYPRLGEIPFDSDRKLMTTINSIDGQNTVIVKGAFDVMAERCISGELEKAKSIAELMSEKALRVLAVGYKKIEAVPDNINAEKIESGLIFMGLVGMIDPPRRGVKEAVSVCRTAGIKPVMITGDHIITASAIATEIGILENGGKAVTGAELDLMTDEELDCNVEKISVYARVSPENKIRIVKAWQRKDRIVSMTGDGVNDAPALKAADIGCAMGITGTDVAKEVADIILTDDNFATIVEAVREGRGIYENIKKVVGFLIGTNIGEVITVFTAMIVWHKTPLSSIQLLWINLVTDSMPAIALGMETVEKDIMKKRPKLKDEGIFAHGLGLRVFLQGIMFAVLTLVGFKMGENVTGKLAGGRTLAFIVLSLSQIVQAYNMRSNRLLFKIGIFSNKKLNSAAFISVFLVLLVLFTPLRFAFEFVILPKYLYILGIGLICVPLLITECLKLFGIVK